MTSETRSKHQTLLQLYEKNKQAIKDFRFAPDVFDEYFQRWRSKGKKGFYALQKAIHLLSSFHSDHL